MAVFSRRVIKSWIEGESPYLIEFTLKTDIFVVLLIILICLPLGNSNLSFGETPMDADMVMIIDENSLGEGKMFKCLTHFTAALVLVGGNMEIVVLSGYGIGISAVLDRE